MRGKRILFLSPFVPSKRAGGENFTRLLLEKLSGKNEIDLIYYRYGNDLPYLCPNANIKVLREVINSTFLKLIHAVRHPFMHPIFTVRFDHRLLAYIKQTMQKNRYDLLYLDHSQMFFYGKYFPNIKKVLMAHDVMAQRYSRNGCWLSKKIVLKDERQLMHMPNSTVFVFSEKDCNIIKKLYNVKSQATNFFLDSMVIKAKTTQIGKRIIFFGNWSRDDNLDGLRWFFNNVYGKIDPRINISIIGGGVPKSIAVKLSYLKNVECLGFVDNPYDMIANSMATVSTLFSGAGVKVKVVESLACGTPVIGGEISFEGISSIYSEFMLEAETEDEYANIINGLTITVAQRQRYKTMFLSNYQNQSIVNFINNRS